MKTFELDLTGEWQEVLQGKPSVSFDMVSSSTVEVYYNETASTPLLAGNKIQTWPNGWDFQSGVHSSGQRIWVKGTGKIRGVR